MAFFESPDLACSVHSGGGISVLPQSRPGLGATIPPALLLGTVPSLAGVATVSVASRLDTG